MSSLTTSSCEALGTGRAHTGAARPPPAASLPAVLRSNVLAHGHQTERVREGILAPGRPGSWGMQSGS